MKFLLIAALLVACRTQAEGPDRWAEVEALATPTVAPADGAQLKTALDRVAGDEVPEVALEEAIVWRRAGGGLPWRDGRRMDDPGILRAYKLGEALLERRGTDPEAVITALYLAQRLRGEAPLLIDVTIGFTLATKAIKLAARPEYAPYAPTEAEARRAIPADAVHFVAMLKDMPQDDPTIARTMKKAFADMLVGAPADRAAYVKRIDEHTTRAQKSTVLSLMVTPKLPALAKEMFDAIDSYAAWLRAYSPTETNR